MKIRVRNFLQWLMIVLPVMSFLYTAGIHANPVQNQLRDLIKGESIEICAEYMHVLPSWYTIPDDNYWQPQDNADVPLPFVKGYIHPAEFQPGEEVTIQWEVRHADQVYIRVEGASDIGEVDNEGSRTITPPTTKITTYIIEAHGAGGNVQTHRMQAIPEQSSPPYHQEDLALNVQFIDHWNLRYPAEPGELDRGWSLEEQVRAIKQNIDVASRWGASEYLLFSKKDVFEYLLDYDFTIEGQNVAEAAGWDPDPRYQAALHDVIAHAHARDIDLIFHTNEFHIDGEIEEVVGEVEAGSEVLWEITEKKLQEFFELYPAIDGLQLTGDETTYNIENTAQAIRLGKVASRAAGPERKVILRLWDRIGVLGTPTQENIEDMAEGRDNVWLSFKNTAGDFGWVTDQSFNDEMVGEGDPERQYVEFDAWREYDGNNVFPFYYGDVWADRVQEVARRGVNNIAVRLNWNSGYYNMVENKWAGWVNIYVLLGLADNPDEDPDSLLRNYIDRYYPDEEQESAFNIYKYSPEFMASMYYPTDNGDVADHGRIPEDDKLGRAGDLGNEFFEEYDQALVEMLKRIEKLSEDVSFKQDLYRGAWLVNTVAKGINMRNDGASSEKFKYGWLYADTKSWVQFRGHLLDGDEADYSNCRKVIDFSVKDKSNGKEIFTLVNDSTIAESDFPDGELVVEAVSNFVPDSVVFNLNGEHFVDSQSPFTLNLTPADLSIGYNSLQAIPYKSISGVGDMHGDLNVEFSVVQTINHEWREAESASDQTSFAPFDVYESTTASGGEYIMVDGQESSLEPPSKGIAKYNVDFNDEEVLSIWFRVLYDFTAGHSFWVRFGDGEFQKFLYDEDPNTWGWKEWDKRISTGMDTLVIAYRGENFQLDQLLITNNLGSNPKYISENIPSKTDENKRGAKEQEIELGNNYPNPMNSKTSITYKLPREANVNLAIYDISGRMIATLIDDHKPAGKYDISYNTSDLATGVYFYKLIVNDRHFTKKMAVIK